MSKSSKKSFYDMVSALVDAIGIPLAIMNKSVAGVTKLTFENPTSIPMVMRPSVVKSFGSNGLGLLVHVSGDLYLIAYCLESSGVVSVYVLDGKGKSKDYLSTLASTSDGIRGLIDMLRPSIAASFYWSGASWAKLKLPQ